MAVRRPLWTSVVLWMLVITLLLPFCLGKHEKPMVTDKDLNRRKEVCYVDIDNGMWGTACRSSWVTRENCALRCVSASCYNTIYGEDPMEEGEVDFRRGREFRQCLRREMQNERKFEK